MSKPMKRRAVIKALKRARCRRDPNSTGREPHDKWLCPCGKHSANVPRHREITAGVVGSMINRLSCLEKGWLQ